jgi:hypothetical protein
MGRQGGDQSQLFYLFNLERRIPIRASCFINLERRIPACHLLRRLICREAVVFWPYFRSPRTIT